jgi:hypothetical protein
VLFLVHRFLSFWWWRRYVSLKLRFLQEPRCVTSQKTPFFHILRSSNIYKLHETSTRIQTFCRNNFYCCNILLYNSLVNCQRQNNSVVIYFIIKRKNASYFTGKHRIWIDVRTSSLDVPAHFPNPSLHTGRSYISKQGGSHVFRPYSNMSKVFRFRFLVESKITCNKRDAK